jgi:hypothetical protein
MGGFVYSVRLRASEGRESDVVAALKRQILPGLVDLPRITGVHLVENDPALTAGNAGKPAWARDIPSPFGDPGRRIDGRRSARRLRSRLGSDRLRALGVPDEMHHGLYQLEFSIQNLAQG